MTIASRLAISQEVLHAQANDIPVVALESTIITHGMPHPTNVETARAVESIIRARGAVPATIAILDGKIHIGLSAAELEALAVAPRVEKVSRRDLAHVLATRAMGATTVAATMICARLANLTVFVTGGIGGVHRGAAETLDISADLMELANTNVAVVCAGAKSILDIGLTLEFLETHGVPVIGYGTDEFPAFYARQSGHSVDFRLDSPQAIATVLRTKWDMGIDGGAVIANPVPEAFALQPAFIDGIIEQALREASARGVRGKAVTPFLLQRVADLTGGSSLQTNVALVKHNAALGADIARALVNLPVLP